MVSATEAETVDRPATGPEIVALNASVVAKMRARAFGASVPIPSEAKAPRNGKRRPLGLAPIDGDDDKAAAAPAFVAGLPSAAASFTAETLARGAVMADVAESLDCATAIALDLAGALKAQIAELHGENARLTTELARLRAQFAEAKAEFGEAKHILERLQITREGKRGERGPCGADGAPGPRGEKGERGERGAPALTVIEWRPEFGGVHRPGGDERRKHRADDRLTIAVRKLPRRDKLGRRRRLGRGGASESRPGRCGGRSGALDALRGAAGPCRCRTARGSFPFSGGVLTAPPAIEPRRPRFPGFAPRSCPRVPLASLPACR